MVHSTHASHSSGHTHPSQADYQYLEDISTAYWQSEVFFSAMELKLFDHIENKITTIQKLCTLTGCLEDGLFRLMRVLKQMDLVEERDGVWRNSHAARRYLVRTSPFYMGDFFLYRRVMQENFRLLTRKISLNNDTGAERCGHRDPATNSKDDYAARNLNYVRSLDQLAKEKAKEIVEILFHETWESPILDLGGGAGSICRLIVASFFFGEDQKKKKNFSATGNAAKGQTDASCALPGVLLDLPEVIDAARKIYPDKVEWEGIETIEADFRFHGFAKETTFGIIVMSNFLHTYGEKEARKLLEKALCLLKPGGKVLIHDYFPDRQGRNPVKGAFYDLAMMLNTYNGKCHEASKVVSWLEAAGIQESVMIDLETDSSVILAGEKLRRDHRG
jgi:SAM-dependent methyltransferase